MPTKDEMIDKGFNLIPVNEINIQYDENETVGYDFTVDDWYTFCTHDGVYVQDTLAIYIPITEKTIKEVKGKILSSNNLVNPANDSLVMTPGQDIVLGIYFLTNNKFEELRNKVIYKDIEITESLKIFNECFPEDYPLINEPVNKKKLINILDDVRKKYDNNTTVEVLDNIKKIGFKYSTLFGSTLSLNHFEIENLQELKDDIYSTDNNIEQLNKLNSDEIKEILKENFHYSYMVESGARGDWSQVNQIVFTRGFVSNFKGQILPEPIKNSLLNGLTQKEFFNSTYGCRKGLMDVAINTGTSGYLSRKLNMAMINLQVDDELDDCGTEDTLSLYVKNEYNAKMLMHRYYKNENNQLIKINEDNYKDIIGNTIKLRSPLFCKEHKLCKTCYGDLYKIINSKFVGVISAQSLGETNTQMILRTFHQSLRKNTEVIDINQNSYKIEDVYDLIKEGKDFYTFSCSPKGEIVVSKVIDAYKDRFEKKMVRVTLDNDEVIECTLDHEWIMRDGSSKQAKDLVGNDLLIPIYNDYYVIKVKKVEFIELDEYEEFYDLSVDSEYENFALKAGIFIHNSGVANIGNTGETDSLLQQDIVADLSMTSKLLHSGAKDYNHDELVCKLFDTYNHSRSIHYVHFECLVSQMMWSGNKKWRLLENRNEVESEYQSIQSIPTMESWLLGLSFSSPKKHILEGILYSDNYKGIIDDLLCGEKVY